MDRDRSKAYGLWKHMSLPNGSRLLIQNDGEINVIEGDPPSPSIAIEKGWKYWFGVSTTYIAASRNVVWKTKGRKVTIHENGVVVDFTDGKIAAITKEGGVRVVFPDGRKAWIRDDGMMGVLYPDGYRAGIDADGFPTDAPIWTKDLRF